MRREGRGGGGPSVPLTSFKWYITMVDIVVVRCYGDRLSFRREFCKRNFSLRGNPGGGRESYNSHVPKLGGGGNLKGKCMSEG